MPDNWDSFGVMVGGASGALTGLLFVAVSLNIGHIAPHRAIRIAAGRTLILFVIPLMAAILMLVPGQPAWALGSELVATAVGAAYALGALGRIPVKDEEGPALSLARILDRATPSLGVCLFVAIAGLTLIAHTGGGLYWLVPADTLALLSGVTNAWLLLIRLPT